MTRPASQIDEIHPGPRPAGLPAGGRRDQGGARPGRHDAVRLRELERRRDRLDLRRPRHLQEVQGARRVRPPGAVVGRPSRVLARRAEGRLAARLPRAGRGGSRRRGAAAADAAEGGARRRRPARDPQAGGAEAPSRADASPRSRIRSRISSASRTRWTTSSCACRSSSCATSARRCATRTGTSPRSSSTTCCSTSSPATRRRGATRSPTTSARPPASRRCSTSRPASRPRCARSSTRSSRSART